MDNLKGIEDIMESLAKSKQSNPSKKSTKVFKSQNLSDCLYGQKAFKNDRARDEVARMIMKDLKSPDINVLRINSTADRIPELADDETIFTNIAEMNGTVPCTDLHVSFREKRIGSDTADWINMNVGTISGEAYLNRPSRKNTIGFAGNKIDIKLITSELGKQSPVDPTDLMMEEVDFEMIRIRRFFEQQLLSNTEVNIESTVAPTEPGGFITRSTLYNVSTSGDLTNALIQGRVDAIANKGSTEALGYNVPLVAFCPAVQLGKIRDLMASRYSAETNVTALGYQQRLMDMFAEKNMHPNAVQAYQPLPGHPVLFLYNSLMPSGTVLFFDPRYPQLGKFQINGQYGPWVLERPTEAMTQLMYVFDGMTLIEHLVESRAVLTGINVS